jgi:RRXRR protein/HNH endonuclease
MPCQPRRARLLLEQGKAKVVKMAPFTIQLLHGSSGYKQAVSLGVDAGTHHIGVSAATEKHVLFEAEVLPRTDIQALLATRSQYRRARRSRKTRHRKARFLNRKKPAGWLAPSVRHKVACHIKTIALIHKILPILLTTIEVAQFDLQKMKHSEIAGVEYQQGPQLGYWNVREYVLIRDNHTCQWCGSTSKDLILNVHHIESRKTGGDRPDNLITLCERCYRLIHCTHQEHKIHRPSGRLREATHMGIMRWCMYGQAKTLFPNVRPTYGYLTKHKRITHQLEKSHLVDARCISGHPLALSDDTRYVMKMVRRNNRQLRKATIRKGGKGSAIRRPGRYMDFACSAEGVLVTLICAYWMGPRSVPAPVSYKKLNIIQRASTCLVERRAAFSSQSLKAGRSPCRT